MLRPSPCGSTPDPVVRTTKGRAPHDELVAAFMVTPVIMTPNLGVSSDTRCIEQQPLNYWAFLHRVFWTELTSSRLLESRS